MTFKQFAKEMYYENRNERREYGEKLYDTFEEYLESNKSFLMEAYREYYGS
tara:strand:- start:67 stop:219 length:153 start_codon:yes stop_codon:yes gene_type:complete